MIVHSLKFIFLNTVISNLLYIYIYVKKQNKQPDFDKFKLFVIPADFTVFITLTHLTFHSKTPVSAVTALHCHYMVTTIITLEKLSKNREEEEDTITDSIIDHSR